ncbi:uncharacterized protein N7469_002297 [Penicillium citrinum]|uniref:Uncharacterized protein n=1 Tax=Penicillium citrinum TaxID=5077 RepID=A0A9W9PA27_PENCI|nr:uncharacterized protein N7469_002297 [Penicillium citrinum]KAJ5240706.1 hypothetical protein N7469_002297 [Penicillium citrinum]
MLMTSQFKGSGGRAEKVRILGTYTSVTKSKDAAHRCLFDAGYEREWFSTFETNPETLEELASHYGTGIVVYAIAVDGTMFRVRISTSPNKLHLTTHNEDGRVPTSLYYVVQTNAPYCSHERRPIYDTHVEGIFKAYDEARKFAKTLLLIRGRRGHRIKLPGLLRGWSVGERLRVWRECHCACATETDFKPAYPDKRLSAAGPADLANAEGATKLSWVIRGMRSRLGREHEGYFCFK